MFTYILQYRVDVGDATCSRYVSVEVFRCGVNLCEYKDKNYYELLSHLI